MRTQVLKNATQQRRFALLLVCAVLLTALGRDAFAPGLALASMLAAIPLLRGPSRKTPARLFSLVSPEPAHEEDASAYVDALTSHIAFLDEDGTILSTNSAWKNFALANGGAVNGGAANGKAAADLAEGANYLAVCDAAASRGCEDAATAARLIRQAIVGESSDLEMEYECHQGTRLRWFLCRVTRVPGFTPRVAISHRDITALKMALLDSEKSRTLFESLATGSPLGVFHFETGRGIRFFNDHGDSDFGISSGTKDGYNWIDILHPDDFHLVQELWQGVFLRAEATAVEIRTKRPNGATQWIIVRAAPLRSPNGEVHAAVGTFLNATEKHRLDEAFRFLAAELPDADGLPARQQATVLRLAELLDVEIAYLAVTIPSSVPAARTIALCVDGQSANDLVIPLHCAIGADVLAADGPTVFRLINSRFPADFAAVRYGAQESAGISLRNSTGEQIGFLAVASRRPLLATDTLLQVLQLFATRLAAEIERESAQADLERHVVERTKSFELVNRELDAFAVSASHDLRAPLRRIQGFANLLEEEGEGRLTDQEVSWLRTITRSSNEMRALIEHLLTTARATRAGLGEQALDLSSMFRKTLREAAADCPGRQITVDVQPIPSVFGEPVLIQQVLVNLVSNALKYTKTRQQTLVEVGTAGKENGRIIVYVRDNGVGLNMANADRLFGMFQRLPEHAEFEGTGVGLASVQRMIERHGGRIWVESEPGQGATFFFTLKAAASA